MQTGDRPSAIKIIFIEKAKARSYMDWFELENLESIRIALVLVGLMGVIDLAIGNLSGSALALPCAIGAVGIRAYQENKSGIKPDPGSRD